MTLDVAPKTLSAASLTVDEQVSLGTGQSFWITKTLPGLPSIILTDGPHGVRRQVGRADHLGIAASEPATCFPPAAGLAQSWDVDLAHRVGAALGVEARRYGVGVLLGPGINIKRDPRCGRNFEYFSEDPLLSGELGAAWIRGLQGCGVGASVKHFAANNQEFERMRVSADIDERPLREIYLRSFERAVKTASPWTVMAAYNRLNGVAVTENRWLLTEVLRDEWGFDGVVVSDWGAVGDRVAAVAAGLDLQMPGGDSEPDRQVSEAVAAGQLAETVVTASAQRVIDLVQRVSATTATDTAVDVDAHHRLAREAAGRSIVLLKNDDRLLPLSSIGTLAVIGEFAVRPRFQGGGSSRVNPTRVDVPVDEIRALAPSATISYAPGFLAAAEEADPALIVEAARIAEDSDAAVVFLGLDTVRESEGADRRDIELPAGQVELLAAVAEVQPKTVVVLMHGGVLRLGPVAELVPAILDGALLGQAAGGAVADALFGIVNPSGRLAETAPVRIEDAPSFLNFPGDNLAVRYGEGIFVGYRGYDARRQEVEFCFGHGLSYTTFGYTDLSVESVQTGIRAAVTITNTGTVEGREVAQFYVGLGASRVARAPRELKAFTSATLAPGQSVTVEATISRSDLAYWDTRVHGWQVEGGTYEVAVGASSRDIRLTDEVIIDADPLQIALTVDTSIVELLANPVGAAVLAPLLAGSSSAQQDASETELGIDTQATMAGIPIGRIRSLTGGQGFTRTQLEDLLTQANAAGTDSAPSGRRDPVAAVAPRHSARPAPAT